MTNSSKTAAAKTQHIPSKALVALAQNLARLMDERAELGTAQKVAQKTSALKKVSYKTIQRILRHEHEPQIDTVEAIAKVFGLTTWQLLLPGLVPGEKIELKREIPVEA